MKNLLSLICITILSVSAFSQKGAKIEFKRTTVDYGKIEYGSDGVRVFEFTNTGDAPLVITKVKSTCGCTVPTKPDGAIAPGEKGVIRVKYDTKRPGFIRKTITVTSNATNAKNGLYYLKIKGSIKAPKGFHYKDFKKQREQH